MAPTIEGLGGRTNHGEALGLVRVCGVRDGCGGMPFPFVVKREHDTPQGRGDWTLVTAGPAPAKAESLNQDATYPRRSPIQYNGLANGVHLSRIKNSCSSLE